MEPTHYHYDQQGHVARVEQGNQSTRYQHNAKGDVTAIHYPDGSRASLAYNANRQLTEYTDPLGRKTRFEYDGLAQVTRRIDPAGNSLHYHYDRERNLIGLTNENGEHYQLKYDACERLIEEIGFDGRDRPVAVAVDYVATVAVTQQRGVPVLALGPLAGPRADAHLGRAVRHRVVRRSPLLPDRGPLLGGLRRSHRGLLDSRHPRTVVGGAG